MVMRTLHSAFLTSLVTIVPLLSRAAETPAPQLDIPMREVLVLGTAGRGGRGGRDGRSAVHTDPVEARIVTGEWTAPVAGGVVVFPGGAEQTWKAATADTNGVLNRAESRNGYVFWPYTSTGGQVMLLEAAGHSFGYVNGEIHAGDPYGYGYIHVPVLLRPGVNEFLFQCSREGLRARLKPANGPLIVDTADPTLPDIIIGETEPVWGAAILLNATTNFMSVSLRANGRAASEQAISIPPLAGRKAPFRLHPPSLKQTGEFRVELEATDTLTGQKAKAEFKLRVRRPEGTYKRTFISSIDDSVQYYGVNPALSNPAPALFLSLHGASVEGMGQADACSPKIWGNIISPTNRRPYGFDWEDWGRWDAFEVLDLAQARYHPDPALPQRPFDWRARHLAPRRQLPGPLRRHRPERRLDQFHLLRPGRREPFNADQ